MRGPRWAALPISLTVLTLILTGLRIRIVRQRASDWSGEGCVIGPYNPAERYYLYAITALLILSAITAILLVVRTESAMARLTALGLVVVCGLIALYALYVWGGFEFNNQPTPEEPCPAPGHLLI
ncbi:hypothetical protein [Mycolicibacterium komossense]|uniref:Uncharacterized protein n=1 Tax=Mycolicibacterium komossense TaxID=1779 RepID=A0ABT3CM15_9MYCO|nr:hypothetical protein [Mycolicibacterium komossense]MCV7230485.1 hypothetical protein [Mycolicibacterium komossense]